MKKILVFILFCLCLIKANAGTDGCGPLEIKLKGGTEEFTYPDKTSFKTGTECVIKFIPPTPSPVSMTIPKLNFEDTDKTNCPKGYVAAADTEEAAKTTATKHCGTDPVNVAIESEGNMFVYIKIVDDSNTPDFKLKFISAAAPGTDGCGPLEIKLKGGTEEFAYPDKTSFKTGTECVIKFIPPTPSPVSMTIPKLNFEDTDKVNCPKGYVAAADTEEAAKTTATKHCGTDPVNVAIESEGNMFVYIKIVDDSNTPDFKLKFISGAMQRNVSIISVALTWLLHSKPL